MVRTCVMTFVVDVSFDVGAFLLCVAREDVVNEIIHATARQGLIIRGEDVLILRFLLPINVSTKGDQRVEILAYVNDRFVRRRLVVHAARRVRLLKEVLGAMHGFVIRDDLSFDALLHDGRCGAVDAANSMGDNKDYIFRRFGELGVEEVRVASAAFEQRTICCVGQVKIISHANAPGAGL